MAELGLQPSNSQSALCLVPYTTLAPGQKTSHGLSLQLPLSQEVSLPLSSLRGPSYKTALVHGPVAD